LLHKQYYSSLKRSLGNRLRVYGMWLEDQLVGFYSSIRAFSTLEAHFLGYDTEVARSYDLYLTILLNLIKEAIEEKVENVFFARTAQEIKSSVGAVPLKFHNYLRHKQLVPNQLVPLFLRNLVPKETYQLRNPFKQA